MEVKRGGGDWTGSREETWTSGARASVAPQLPPSMCMRACTGESSKAGVGVGVSTNALVAVETAAAAPGDFDFAADQASRSAGDNEARENSGEAEPAPRETDVAMIEHKRRLREMMFMQVRGVLCVLCVYSVCCVLYV